MELVNLIQRPRNEKFVHRPALLPGVLSYSRGVNTDMPNGGLGRGNIDIRIALREKSLDD